MVVDEDGRFVAVTTLEKVETLDSILGTGKGEGNQGLREIIGIRFRYIWRRGMIYRVMEGELCKVWRLRIPM